MSAIKELKKDGLPKIAFSDFELYESIFEAVVSNISIQTSEFIKLALKVYVIT